MVKLPSFLLLKEYLRTHMSEGFYLLLFRKCYNISCCQKKTDFPQTIPAPIVCPDSNNYLKFSDTYENITVTEKDYPSLQFRKTCPSCSDRANQTYQE